jgi:hypothetical protein
MKYRTSIDVLLALMIIAFGGCFVVGRLQR